MYTVAQWLEAWIETRVRLRDNTRRVYKSHIPQHLRRVSHGAPDPAKPGPVREAAPGPLAVRGGLDERARRGMEADRGSGQ